jgi:hypothetical protein
MNAIDFCFWLQGHFEISDSDNLSPKQVEVIKNHLQLVFKHEIDPLREEQTNASKDELNATHSPAASGNDPLVRC